jgi:hypothetical protein
VWYAFRVLSAQRSMGFSGPNPITIDAIFHMADHLLIDRDEALFFLQGLDETFIEEIHKKKEREAPRTKTPRR